MSNKMYITAETPESSIGISRMPPADMTIYGPVKLTVFCENGCAKSCVRADWVDFKRPELPHQYSSKYECGDVIFWNHKHFMVTADTTDTVDREKPIYRTMCLETGSYFEFGSHYADQNTLEVQR